MARRLQVGGWGYLFGDEGSGFWIGSQLLSVILRLKPPIPARAPAMNSNRAALVSTVCSLSRARDSGRLGVSKRDSASPFESQAWRHLFLS